MKKIVLCSLCTIFYLATQAQQNYEKTYKKAWAFTSTDQDSAMVWTAKCLALAQTQKQKYKAYYLQGFNANKLCMFGTAKYNYKQALKFAPDSIAYFRINNNLANTYLSLGEHKKAIRLNQKSISFSQRAKKWLNLSYAYEVQSNILVKQKDTTALRVLTKALNLRKEHAPEQLGYIFESLAIAYAAFTRYDSAIAYQHLAIKYYPIKSSNKTASLHTQLAKYLIMANQANKAFRHLEKARHLKKPPMMQLFWCHTFGLYLAKTNRLAKAQQTFTHCNDLLQNLLDNAPDWVTQRTISEYAQEMYQDVLALERLKVTERQLYETRLRAVKASYERAKTEIRLKDTLYQQRLAYNHPPKASSEMTNNAQQPIYKEFWFGFTAGIIILVVLGGRLWAKKRLRQAKTMATSQSQPNALANVAKKTKNQENQSGLMPAQLQEMQQLLAENNLIKLVEDNQGATLASETKDMIRLYYQGLSMKKIAEQMRTTYGTVRYRLGNIAEKAGYDTMKDLVDAHKNNSSQPSGDEQQSS